MTYYRQCLLIKNNKHMVSRVPEKFASLNKTLEIKINKQWDNGWVVKSIWTRLGEDQVIENSRDYKLQRIVSDI